MFPQGCKENHTKAEGANISECPPGLQPFLSCSDVFTSVILLPLFPCCWEVLVLSLFHHNFHKWKCCRQIWSDYHFVLVVKTHVCYKGESDVRLILFPPSSVHAAPAPLIDSSASAPQSCWFRTLQAAWLLFTLIRWDSFSDACKRNASLYQVLLHWMCWEYIREQRARQLVHPSTLQMW